MTYILLFLFKFFKFLYEFVFFINREIWKYDLDKHEIINSVVPKNDIKVSSNKGDNLIGASHIKKKYQLYELILSDGKKLVAADEHLIFTTFGYAKYIKDLKIGEPIVTKDGYAKVKKIHKLSSSSICFDLTIVSEDKSYFTNDILSHNSITSAIFIVWYLLFHKDRNVMCVSENGDKVEELMDKIETVFKELPFYMKLGVHTNNIFTKVYDNGCKLKAQKTTENTGASFTIHLLYADEFALINQRFINDFYRTVYPTLSSSEISKMIITSTPRGLNKFYDIYQGALESKNEFNPIRTDWYEVPLNDKQGNPLKDENGNILYRGEEWKRKMVAQLGSEEDFNQEFGNQFLAGNKLLFASSSLKKLKNLQTDFVHRDIDVLEDLEIDYEGVLIWHPKFNIENLLNESCKFVVSIDLADGGGGDYSVANIFQILPMSKPEIESLKIFTNDKDFFKCVQVGLLRSNTIQTPEFARLCYHLVVDVILHDNVKGVIEMNHDGNYFKELLCSMEGDENRIEEDHFFVKFKYNMRDESSQAMRFGINMTDPTKELACKLIKDKVKYNQIIPIEKTTVEECISYSRNNKGVFEGQGRNDDCVCTCRNLSLYLGTIDYLEQIEELIDFCPDSFMKLIDSKMNRKRNESYDDDDITDILI